MKLSGLFLTFSIAACNATSSEPTTKNQSIETRMILPKSGNLSPDQARGFRAIFEIKCKSGDNFYCLDLAKMLMEGIGGDKDQDRAALLIKNACRDGVELACAQIR